MNLNVETILVDNAIRSQEPGISRPKERVRERPVLSPGKIRREVEVAVEMRENVVKA